MEPSPQSLEQRLTEALPRLQAHLRRRTPDPDDVAQEVFVRALRYGESFDSSRALWPWLRRVVDRVLQDRKRAEARRPKPVQDLDPAAAEVVPSAVAREDADALLARLRPIERDVLVRFHQAGESVLEIAEALGLPEGTVKSRLSRARKRLAQLPPGNEEIR